MTSLITFLSWLGRFFRDDSNESSKRLFGGLLILWVITMASMGKEHELLDPALYTGAALLGADVVRKTFSLKTSMKAPPDEKPPKLYD